MWTSLVEGLGQRLTDRSTLTWAAPAAIFWAEALAALYWHDDSIWWRTGLLTVLPGHLEWSHFDPPPPGSFLRLSGNALPRSASPVAPRTRVLESVYVHRDKAAVVDRIPFSIYDFFGCLTAGFVLLIATDYAFDAGWLLQNQLSVVTGAFWVVVAYIVGHVIANMAGHVIERRAVRGGLGAPDDILLEDARRHGWHRLFPGYFTPLPIETRSRVLDRAGRCVQLDAPGRALFFHCHTHVRRHPVVRDQLASFLYLYGFCRNTCLALLLAALTLLIGAVTDPFRVSDAGSHAALAIASTLVGAIGMFYRYLKFYRDYTSEVFRSYAELPEKEEC